MTSSVMIVIPCYPYAFLWFSPALHFLLIRPLEQAAKCSPSLWEVPVLLSAAETGGTAAFLPAWLQALVETRRSSELGWDILVGKGCAAVAQSCVT